MARRVSERELDQGVDVPFLGELLLIPRHPRRWHRPINGHARFIDGYFAKGLVVASYLQGNQSTVAVAHEQGGARLRLQGEHVLTLFDDAVISALRTALAASPAFDGVD